MFMDNWLSTWILENIAIYDFLNEFFNIILTINTFGILWLGVVGYFIYQEYNENKKFDYSYLVMLIPVVLGLIINIFLIQNGVARPHPFEVIEGFSGTAFTTYSFPSIATFISISFCFILTIKQPEHATYYYIGAAVIALCELTLGVSYVSDIILGAGLGVLCGALGNVLNKYVVPLIFKNNEDK